MMPDHSRLLADLTAAPNDSGEALVHALRLQRRRKGQRRALAVGGLGIATIAAAIRLLPHEPPPAPIGVEPARIPLLTPNELLDAFGDQPVALVTWPDGRQQLLAITTSPLRGARPH